MKKILKYISRFYLLHRLRSKVGIDNKVTTVEGVLIDGCDVHPITVARNLSLIKAANMRGYRVTIYAHSLAAYVGMFGWKGCKQFVVDKVGRLIAYRGVDMAYSANINVLWLFKKNKMKKQEVPAIISDLVLDGMLRAEMVPSIEMLGSGDVNRHRYLADEILQVTRGMVESAKYVFCGHRTYYFRGILYRLSGLRENGIYVGPRLNNFIIKKLNENNVYMTLENSSDPEDFFVLTDGRPSQENAWLKKLRSKSCKQEFTRLEMKIPLLCFHIWIDDNIKGRYNLFGTHYSAALEIARYFCSKGIPFYYKFHPQSKNYGMDPYNDRLSNIFKSENIQCYNVSDVSNDELFKYVSLVVTGNGSVVSEASRLSIPFICYCDAHYYREGVWSFPENKKTFFENLEDLNGFNNFDTVNLKRHNYLCYEGKEDFSFLTENFDGNCLDIDSYVISERWADRLFDKLEEGE